MSELAANLLGALARTSLFLALAAILIYLLLRALRSTSPTVHRVAACFVLLQGLILFQFSIPIPWYEPPHLAASLADSSIAETVAPVRPSLGGWRDLAELPRGETEEPSLPAVVPSPSESITTGVPWSWPIVLTVGWLVGVVLFILVPLKRYTSFVRGFQYSESTCAEWNSEWLALLSERAIDRHIPLCVSKHTGPLLCRLRGGYKLVVPASLWGRLAGPQRLTILRHELAHYERGDIWKSLLVRLMALPHWFNPFARWATQRFDEAAEWACDQEVKQACSEWSTEYAKALLAVGRHADIGPCHCHAVRGRGLSVRIHRLLSECVKRDSAMTKVAVSVTILGLVAVHAVRLELVAQEVPADVAEAQVPSESRAQTVVYKTKNRLPDIVESVRINEALYDNIEMVYRKSYRLEPSWLKKQIAGSAGDGEDDSGYLESLDTTVRVVLQEPLFYLKADESGPTPWAGDVLQAYDGAATRVVSQIGDEQQVRVYQERMPDRRALTPHTFLFADLLRFNSLSEDLAKTTTEEGEPVEWRFEREETVNGLVCVRLRCDALTPLDRDVMWSVVVWLATERNYLPVKREGYRSSFSVSHPVERGVAVELREIAPGTWFPMRVRTTSFDEQSLSTPNAQIRSESQLTVEKVELDPAYDVDFFRNIPFPEGVPVEMVERKDAAGAVEQAQATRKKKAKWSVMLEDINRDEKDFYTLDHDAAQSFAFMPNGQTLVTAGDHFSATRRAWFGEVNLWNAATGKVMATFEKKGRSYRASRGSLAISPDGKRIAAVGRRRNAANDFRDLVDLWDVTTGEITNTLIGEPGPILFATFSPDGESLAVGRIKGIVEIWNALNGNQIAKFETKSESIAYTPDGKVLMTGGAGIAFWDAARGKRLAHIEPIDDVKWFDSLCLSADARVLAASGIREIGGQSRIYLWDIVYPADGPLTVNARYRGKLVGHSDHIYTLAFSPDGRKLASGSGDTKVRIWDVPSEREELCLHDHTDFVYCVAFSPDGENLATIGRDSLKFWELTALLQSAER